MVREVLKHRTLFSMLAGLCAMFISATALATMAPRHALIIGNSTYQTAPLRNPVNDASDIADTLHQLGFEVNLLRDASLRKMEDALSNFARDLRHGGLGLFYFAGHGIQIQGENYLIPLDAQIDRAQDARYEALPVGRILGAMEDAGNRLNIVILDACRNNPFASSWRSSQRGLAVVQAAQGSLIAYATSPGMVAADGTGRNGVYTQHLLNLMTQPGLRVEQLFKQVRVAVMQETRQKQVPWESSSLTGDIYLVPRVHQPSPPLSPDVTSTPAAEAEMWNLVKASSHPEDIKFFLQTYPKGQFAPVARLKLQQLQRQSQAPRNPKIEKPRPRQRTRLKPTQTTQDPIQTARLSPSTPPSTAPKQMGHFLLYDQSIALDTATNLMWMTRDFRNVKQRGLRSWAEAEAFAKEMNQQAFGGYKGWRLPTIDEYRTIYDASKPNTSYKGQTVGYQRVFLEGGGRWFWSSIVLEAEFNSTDDTRDDALALDFSTGSVSQEHRNTTSFSVRLVRTHK